MNKSVSTHYSVVLFVLAILASIAFHFAPQFAWYISGVLALIGLTLVGIPHGALDVLTHTSRTNHVHPILFLSTYIASVSLVICGWFFIPTATLAFFLLLSAWHFGQADFELWKLKRGSMCWGTLLLIIILGWHLEEVNSILSAIGVSEAVLSLVIKAELWIKNGTIVGWLIALALAIYRRKKPWFWSLMLLACTPLLPVLIAFMFFFIGQHSVAGWMHLKHGLKLNDRQLWIKAAPFHLGAWAIIGVGVYSLGINEPQTFHATVGWFFAFLGSISIPHIVESHRFIQNLREHS
jgi:Brp/Blh family beta-carotene 15,15'-monooxygenase